MPLECLRRLVDSGLPAHVSSIAEVDNVRLLVAAGLATAQLLAPGSEHQGALVTAVTAEGRAALMRRNLGPAVPQRAE